MAYTAYITTAGQAAIAGAQFGGYKISLTRYRISDSLVTEANPATIRNYTQLPGTVVYDSGNNPTDGSLTYTKLVSGAITINVYLHASIGDFTVGTIGLYLDDGTLFTILKLTQTYSKTQNNGNIAGNVLSFPFTFTLTIQDVLNLTVTPESVASLPLVLTEVDLPAYNLAPYNNYYVTNYAGTNLAAVACKTPSSWQFLVAASNDVDNDWVQQSASSFETGATEGLVVYYDVVTSQWKRLDGEGAEQKLVGIRQGNGVRTGAFYYKLNAFQSGQAYYCDSYPSVGQLTPRTSKYYIGTALTASLLKLDIAYADSSYDGDNIGFYNAYVNSSNEIILTLDDINQLPIAYTNGLKVSFVMPINSVVNQVIRIGTLPTRPLLRRQATGTFGGSDVSINAQDITAGTLVEATFLTSANGFRCSAASLQATSANRGIIFLPNLNVPVNNINDLANDVDFPAGSFVYHDNSGQAFAPPLTKRLDAAWTIGSGNGGLFSGTKAINTFYYCFLIVRDSDGWVDAGFDTSAVGANIPIGWSKRSKPFAVLTDGSGNIRTGTWYSDNSFTYTTAYNEFTNGQGVGSLQLGGVPRISAKAMLQAEVFASQLNAYPRLLIGTSSTNIIFIAGRTYAGGDYANGIVPCGNNATVYRAFYADANWTNVLNTPGYFLL